MDEWKLAAWSLSRFMIMISICILMRPDDNSREDEITIFSMKNLHKLEKYLNFETDSANICDCKNWQEEDIYEIFTRFLCDIIFTKILTVKDNNWTFATSNIMPLYVE